MEEYYTPNPIEITEGYQYEFHGSTVGGMVFIDFGDPESVIVETITPPTTKIWTKEECTNDMNKLLHWSGVREKKSIIELIQTGQIRTKYLNEDDLKSLGWEHVATASNGGSTSWQYMKSHFVLDFNGTNNIFRNKGIAYLREVKVEYIDTKTLDFKTLFQGYCPSKNELIQVMKDIKLIL